MISDASVLGLAASNRALHQVASSGWLLRSLEVLTPMSLETIQSLDSRPTMIDAIPAIAWSCLPDGSVEFLNRRWLDYTGLSLDRALGRGWKATIHPNDVENVTEWQSALLISGEAGEIEARLRRRDGEYRWFLIRSEPIRDKQGHIVSWCGTNTDIEGRKRAESLLAAEKRSLEMIAGGAPLTDILETLCDTIDAQASGIISTAMLMDPDGKRLWPAAGRHVPKEWRAAITPLTIGANIGACGTAAFRSQRVITSDIATDPLWIDYRDLALSSGLRAAWSQPLLSKDREMLGTFAMYYAEPRSPSESDLRLIEGAGHVAVIAIEEERARTALEKASEEIKKSEAELRTIVDAIPQLIIALGADGNFLSANQAVSEFTGLTKEELAPEGFREVFHPQDTERLRDERDAAIARGAAFEYERQIRRKDGQ